MEEQNQNNGSTMDTPAEVRATGEMATVLYGESGTAPQARELVNDRVFLVSSARPCRSDTI